MKFSVSNQKIVTVFDRVVDAVSKEEIQAILQNNSHSVRVFKNNKRNVESCISSRGHMIDFDEETTIEKFVESNFAKHINYILYTSKSHQIEKNGKIQDRFHVILPFQSEERNMEKHIIATKALIKMFKDNGFNVDSACSDVARFFFASGTGEKFQFIWGYSQDKAYITDDTIIAEAKTIEYEQKGQNQPVNSEKIKDAVLYLSDKKLTYEQFVGIGFSVYASLGEAGEEIFVEMANNPNYRDTKESLSAKYKSFRREEFKSYNQKVLFKIANDVAKELGDKTRFYVNNTEVIFDTDIVYSNENYLDFFNSFCAYDIKTGKYWMNFREGGWTLTSEKAAFSITSHLTYSEEKTENKKGKEQITVVTMPAMKKWLSDKNKRYIKELVFTNRKEATTEINLFRGFKYDSIPGDISPFLDFCKEVLCKGDEYKLKFLLNFIAATFQFIKIPHYLILKGGEGTGKSFFAREIIQNLLTVEHCQKAISIDDVIKKFNFNFANKNFCYLEEAFFGGDQSTNDKLKSIITNDVINIEIKGGAIFQMPTVCNYMVTTNHDIPTKVSRDDRRGVIFEVSETRKNDVEYFGTLYKWLFNKGFNHLMHFFLSYEVTKQHWDFNYTDEKREAKEYSMSTVEKYWLDLLQNYLTYNYYDDRNEQVVQYFFNGVVEAARIYDVYVKYCKKSGLKPESQTVFGGQTKRVLKLETKRFGVKRITTYNIDLSECITNFNDYFRQEIIEIIEPYELDSPEIQQTKVIDFPKPKEQPKQKLYDSVKDVEDPPF